MNFCSVYNILNVNFYHILGIIIFNLFICFIIYQTYNLIFYYSF